MVFPDFVSYPSENHLLLGKQQHVTVYYKEVE